MGFIWGTKDILGADFNVRKYICGMIALEAKQNVDLAIDIIEDETLFHLFPI